jgi:predicted glycoside hydrolase/deacetylase ChbG (UPF0249 family)
MAEKRLLIVNADDLGLSEGVNAGIAEAHERGIVTSASLMVRQGAASGLGVDAESSYGPEREREVHALCDPRVRAAIEDEKVELRSFRQAG